MTNSKKWDGFIREIANLIFFWFFAVVFFFIYRAAFIAIYHKEIGGELPISEYIATFFMGFRFDCTAAAYFILIPFFLTLTLSYFEKFNLIRRVRIFCQYAFVILSTFICLVTINYYKEFNDQFNNFLFLGLEDDQEAVLKTIIEYYNPGLNIFLLVAISVIGILIFRYFEKKEFIYGKLKKIKKKYVRILFVIFILYLFAASIRGTLTHPPAMRKWAGVSTDSFLNKTIINPYRSLKYAYVDFGELNELEGDNPFTKDIHQLYNAELVSEVIAREAHGATIEKPKQIFLVIMESYDAWPLMEKYQPLKLSERLSDIARKGMHFTNFLPSYQATFYAYGTITGGIPYCGVNISRIGAMSDVYITSIFNQFKDLGYKTNLFYGGLLSWENIGPFSQNMGCDRLYSGADAKTTSTGVWGIDDEELFNMVLDKVSPDEYSFNVILTSSYHGPYSVDVDSKGFMYQSKDQYPEEMKQYDDGRMSLVELGHLWYSDWAIGKFVEEAEKEYSNSLFAFTGDHYGRRFINHSPNLYERSAVPFILYGKDIEPAHNKTPGSHIDIAPTLIEMIAPKGYKYYSFGESLFTPDKKYGIGFRKVIDRDSLYFAPKDAKVDIINLSDFEEKQTDEFKYQNEYNQMLGLSWHYIIRGDSLSNTKFKY